METRAFKSQTIILIIDLARFIEDKLKSMATDKHLNKNFLQRSSPFQPGLLPTLL